MEQVQLRKVFDNKPDKHSVTQAEMKINKEMACMTIDHLAKVSPEEGRNIKMCKCAARSLATSKLNRFCSDCYLDIPPKEKEVCVVAGESDDTKNNTDPKNPSTLAETKTFLDEQYGKSTNIRVILGAMHQMIEINSEKQDSNNEVVKTYQRFVHYVKSSKNCSCFYCSAKNEIPFLNESKKENCNTATENIKDFFP